MDEAGERDRKDVAEKDGPLLADAEDDASIQQRGRLGPFFRSGSRLDACYRAVLVVLLLIIYFLAQYDKFVLSYFSTEILTDLSISSSGYGLLTGYGTSILSALTALPIAFIADYSSNRVWTLCCAVVWWSLMVIFQGLSKQFWQLICARLGMSFGQSASEAIAVSLISDLVPLSWVPFAESFLYVAVYAGESISARISVLFKVNGTSWRVALKGIGIAGCILAVLVRVIMREPARRYELSLVTADEEGLRGAGLWKRRVSKAAKEVRATMRYLMSLRSFWIITISASLRQLSGNVFGYYMPGYLQLQYPNQVNHLVQTYGIIVGTVGTFASLLGGTISSLLYRRFPTIALHLVAWGGILSSPFVVVMVCSLPLAGGDAERGLTILFGAMAAAYLTAEMWLGPVAALVVRLVPTHLKTTSFALYGLVNLLVYSSGPEIIGIAQYSRDIDQTTDPEGYVRLTRLILAIIIPLGYCLSSAGFLWASRKRCIGRDFEWIAEELRMQSTYGVQARIEVSKRRQAGFWAGGAALAAVVVGLLVSSFVLGV